MRSTNGLLRTAAAVLGVVGFLAAPPEAFGQG
jgi:hypothetical protein